MFPRLVFNSPVRPRPHLVLYRLISRSRLADNAAPRRLHHVRLAGERPGTHALAPHQKPHVLLALSHPHPVVLLCPGMHPARRRQQPDVRVRVGHRVAPHAARLLQVGLALLLHQRSQRRGVGGVVMLSDGDLWLGPVAVERPRRPQVAGLWMRRQEAVVSGILVEI